jgi:hypothetical protein
MFISEYDRVHQYIRQEMQINVSLLGKNCLLSQRLVVVKYCIYISESSGRYSSVCRPYCHTQNPTYDCLGWGCGWFLRLTNYGITLWRKHNIRMPYESLVLFDCITFLSCHHPICRLMNCFMKSIGAAREGNLKRENKIWN